MLIKTPLLHQILRPRVLLSLSLSLYFWLISWNMKASCVTQEILASLLLSLSHHRRRTTRFQSIKGPQLTFTLRNLYAGQEVTVRTEHETTDRFKTGKEYDQAVYCHPAYLNFMQSTSREMPGWMNNKLESRLPTEISTTSEMQCYHSKAESEEELKSLLIKVKENSEKAGVKVNIQKTKIIPSGPITSWQIEGEKVWQQ